jgi:heme/copper-type cytochrome/quinol oxidase subunit 2
VGHDDALSLSMFWTGALMVFTPLIIAAVLVAFVWRQRVRDARAREEHHTGET